MNWKVYYLVFVALLVTSYSNSQSNLLNAIEVDQIGMQSKEKIAADNDMSVLLIGETGTGKTSLVQELAGEAKKKAIRFNLTGETTVDEFVGKYTLKDENTVWEDGILLQAIKKGRWLIVDSDFDTAVIADFQAGTER